jgi:hypothetical protein
MQKLLEILFGRLLGPLLNQVIWICLIGSILASILIVVFLGYFLGVFDGSNILPGFQLSEAVRKQGHPPFFIGSTFLTMVFLLFVVSYWFISRQFEDVYTRLRSHLVGDGHSNYRPGALRKNKNGLENS